MSANNLRKFMNLVESVVAEKAPHDISMLQTHDVLNPKIWAKDRTLLPGFKEHFLKVVESFMDSLSLKELPEIKDILITGSNANFNYTETSDIDLHVIVDSRELLRPGATEEEIYLAKGYLMTKAGQWNKLRNIEVKGVPVELYFEEPDTPPTSGGKYSLLQDRWIVNPRPANYDTENPEVHAKVDEWIAAIEASLRSKNLEKLQDTWMAIRKERRKSLDGKRPGDMSGETSVANMAYRVVRSKGYIERMFDEMDKLKDRELSLASQDLNGEGQQLSEFVAPSVQYHDTFNPKLWDGEELKPAVREKLLFIAKKFLGFLGVNLKVEDIIFKGSNANFNYTKVSDIDVHLVAKVADKKTADIIEARRLVWKQKYKPEVNGYSVELGVDEPGKPHSSSAVFSLKNNAWVSKPVHDRPDIDNKAVNKMAKEWIEEIKAAIASEDINKIRAVKKKLIGIRNDALDATPGAEYKVENLAYKRVRDLGYFDQLNDLIDQDQTASMSLRDNPSWKGIFPN